ncbi:4'-phosphopantetheinyl transferase family protein [Spirosoma flavum]|uniref:4'-phosphopantetheinyl transferase family protein n=1 Tax=Spirosoma flavum TaxID=2048557 RepID=A0ABW6ATN5_9BACT
MTFQIDINGDCIARLRPITEDEPTLRARALLTLSEEEDLASISHPSQRIEWLACRVALRQLIEAQGMPYRGSQKDEYGKPHLIDSPWHISLSHTSGWAAVVLHRLQPVGIDIEPIREQFRRVVPRVLSESEIVHAAGNPNRLAVYWCAKEALYKLYGKRQLTFREHLYIEPFADGALSLIGHVYLPNHEAQANVGPLTIRCFQTGPGLLAVAY